MARKPITGWKRGLLNVFIAFHIFILFFWGLPDSPFRNRMIRPIEKYVVYTGLWHIWGMFAPMPLTTHFDVRAQVKYQDGSTAEWIAPRMEELSVWERVPKERFRKWRERIRSDDYAQIWDVTAQYIARVMNKNPKNPPVEVQLTRYWVEIPPPIRGQDYQPMPKGFNPVNKFIYATVQISPGDL